MTPSHFPRHPLADDPIRQALERGRDLHAQAVRGGVRQVLDIVSSALAASFRVSRLRRRSISPRGECVACG